MRANSEIRGALPGRNAESPADQAPRPTRRLARLVGALGVLACASAAVAQSITTVQALPGGTTIKPYAVNSSGNAVAGYSDDASSNDRAIRWTNPGGTVSMGLLPGGVFNSYAQAIDATGTILAGYGDSGSSRAFRWTTTGGYQLLPVAPGASPSNYNVASGISQSGAVVVGTAGLSTGARAFLWNSSSPGASQNLGVLFGQSSSSAAAVSGDGSTIVGSSGPFAFRYTAGTGMVSLGSLPGQVFALAEAVNTDGSVITGRYSNGSELGYRWTQATGMVALPLLSPNTIALRPRAISGDGKLIIGQVVDTAGVPGGNGIFGCFVWTPAMGTQPLATHLAARGVNLAGWQLTDATGISADGRAMCGQGVFNGVPQGWVVKDLPCASVSGSYGVTAQCVGGIGLIDSLLSVVTGAVYRWEKNGVPIVDGLQPSGSVVTGATTQSINWSNLQAADVGTYTFFMSSQGACESSIAISFPGGIGGITVVAQPSPNTACVGQNPSLFCAATTTTNTVVYRWQKFVSGNWVNLADGPSGSGGSYFGTGTTTFSILNAQVADTAQYRCRLNDSGCGSSAPTYSNAVQFTINGSPSVTGPGDSYQCAGDNDAYISVAVSPPTPPTGSYTYRWQKYVGPSINSYADIFDGPTNNGGFYSGTATMTLGLSGFYPGDFTTYRCRVTGPCGSPVISAPGLLSGIPSAAILTPPANTSVCLGDNDAFLSVVATPGVTYQWQRLVAPTPNVYANIFNGPTGNGGNFGGTNSATLSINGVYPGDLTRYRCVVSEACNSTSAISANALVSATPSAAITSGPTPNQVCAGYLATLSVSATPVGSTFQWQRFVGPCPTCFTNVVNGPYAGGLIGGAQSPTLTFNFIPPGADADVYRCIVSDPCGLSAAISPTASFKLINLPVYQTQPVGGPVCNNGTKSLTFTLAPGSVANSFQWYRSVPSMPAFTPVTASLPSGAIASGLASSTLTISNFQPADAGQYFCQVSTGCNLDANTTAIVSLTSCQADFNCQNGVTVQDLFDFLAAWFAASPSANINGINGVTVQDIFDFMALWFAGC